ncbi:MAG: hydroxysqualene dehydroxylase HpnE [Leptothrix sp. (in: b-proteobacteria)]
MADIAVIGAGWAGLAAAVEALRRGHRVTLYEMAPQAGGRARSQPMDASGLRLDNGQHILIGAYTETLALMRAVGANPDRLLRRLPLRLADADGQGLSLPTGPALIAFGRGVWAQRSWRVSERLALLATAGQWALRGFRCAASTTVAELTASLPANVRQELIDPLCVAALNTPADAASGQVFLRVLCDALFAGPGAADLLLPRAPLAQLLPEPALAWLQANGATLHLRHRVGQLERAPDASGSGWLVDGARHDAIVLACSALEAARLAEPYAPAWAAQAGAFQYEPIITVTVACADACLAAPMIRLTESPDAPAQFAFDQRQIQQAGRRAADTSAAAPAADLYTFVISGAAPWLARGNAAAAQAVLQQADAALRPARPGTPRGPITLHQTITEKRATFRCTPGLPRPPALIAAGLIAAGDYIDGPYPATLEGAVRAGRAAIQQLPRKP